MSLLSDLLNHMPPNVAGVGKSPMAKRSPDRPRLVLVEPAPLPASPYTNAANATPEWRQARDQYISHVMTCRGCYAPGGRHCLTGAELRTTYDNTPMEATHDAHTDHATVRYRSEARYQRQHATYHHPANLPQHQQQPRFGPR